MSRTILIAMLLLFALTGCQIIAPENAGEELCTPSIERSPDLYCM